MPFETRSLAQKNDMLHKVDWPAPKWVCAFTSLKQGGKSQGDYAQFNLADHVGDDANSVMQNRDMLRSLFDPGLKWYWMTQRHTTKVLQAPDDFVTGLVDQAPLGDAMWTHQPGLVMTSLTADCMPVLFCHSTQPIVAAIHAGWKGLLDGILEQALAQLPGQAADYMVWVGPSILQDNFEVTAEFRDEFLAREPGWHEFFKINPSNPQRWLADLPAMAAWILAKNGLNRCYQSGLCTYALQDDFYSFRRQAVTGRMASFIWIDSNHLD